MPIFFVKNDDIDKKQGVVHIYGDDAYHIARSLRMAVGDRVTVSDCEQKYACVLSSIRDSESVANIVEELGRTGEPPYFAEIYQAMPKGDKLETVIQKSVECGAHSIIPFTSEFCTVKVKDDQSEQKKLIRRNKIAYEAAKQCGRTVIPTVERTLSFGEMVSSLAEKDVILFCYENEDDNSIADLFARQDLSGKRIAIIIGSEGGFSEKEARILEQAGALSVSLGQRILRCESAGMFVLSALSFAFEL
ncbi:MAG: 16S rRNA (uracil(1498)-N(3))-methyltransferase [Clostridia bacterium]|nr:16S rRNA (uracil(1498)-N(3))-methyltransferase [Clostridia bacterium]